MRRFVVMLGVVTAVAAACGSSGDSSDEGLADVPAGVVEIDVVDRNHVLGVVDYPTAPPAGGDHFGAWQNCAFYSVPLIDEVAVHSLEHGAVWVTYLPDTDAATLEAISTRASSESHLLASPYENQTAALVLTAWGRQLEVESWDSPAVEDFLVSFLGRRSSTAPEAGVSCSGAIGAPPDDAMSNYDEAAEAMAELEG